MKTYTQSNWVSDWLGNESGNNAVTGKAISKKVMKISNPSFSDLTGGRGFL